MYATDPIRKLLDEYPEKSGAHRWHQPKGDGDTRPIAVPDKELREWLRKMNKALSKKFSAWPEFMHGGIKKRSYVSYARPHVGKACVVTIDIKKCFDSITQHEIATALKRHLNFDDETSARLAELLCFNGRLPQGFPTSNYLCNIYLLGPLVELHGRLKANGVQLSNYVDDLALSGNKLIADEIVNEVAVALSRAKLKMNKAKVSVMAASQPQVICGLLVNKRLSLTRSLKLELLSDIASGRMSDSSAEGWVAHLHSIDPTFALKFYAYAVKKGVLKGTEATQQAAR